MNGSVLLFLAIILEVSGAASTRPLRGLARSLSPALEGLEARLARAVRWGTASVALIGFSRFGESPTPLPSASLLPVGAAGLDLAGGAAP